MKREQIIGQVKVKSNDGVSKINVDIICATISDQIRSDQIRSDQIRSDHIISYHIISYQIRSDQIRNDKLLQYESVGPRQHMIDRSFTSSAVLYEKKERGKKGRNG